MTGHPRIWATVPSRDEYIDGQPARGHVARLSAQPLHAFRCVHACCDAPSEGVGLFCRFHLWTLDHPVLRDAPIFGRVVVL